MPQDKTPLGDAMTHRFPEQQIPRAEPDVPAPDNVPPMGNPDPQPGDDKPKAPPADDEPGRRYIPIELPGREHAPERAGDR
jgi:hypothetical protein